VTSQGFPWFFHPWKRQKFRQELLPFASLVPSAQQRLSLALLQRDLCERAQLLRRRLTALRTAAQGMRSSGAFVGQFGVGVVVEVIQKW
jgi:hypothetical protein